MVAASIVAFRHPNARPDYCFPEDLPLFIADQTRRGRPKLRRNPIHLALEWQRILDDGKAKSRADLVRMLRVSRAHITQVLRLFRLAPAAKEAIFLALGDPITGRIVGAHTLRGLAKLPAEGQQREIARLLSSNSH